MMHRNLSDVSMNMTVMSSLLKACDCDVSMNITMMHSLLMACDCDVLMNMIVMSSLLMACDCDVYSLKMKFSTRKYNSIGNESKFLGENIKLVFVNNFEVKLNHKYHL